MSHHYSSSSLQLKGQWTRTLCSGQQQPSPTMDDKKVNMSVSIEDHGVDDQDLLSDSDSDDTQDVGDTPANLRLIASSAVSADIAMAATNSMLARPVPIPSSVPKGRVEDGEPIKLPESLESLPKSDHFPSQRHRWNTNEEIASMLIAFDRHADWLSKEVKIRPKSGSMLLYSRKKVRYRRDGYCWKKRKDGKTTREDHMKLKVQGMECIYGCYVHSAILPTFHRRCYWLLQNPDIVLVHYLNVPYPDDNKLVIASSVTLFGDKKEWTKEELISQLKPMFFSEEEPDLNNELEISTAETVESIVTQLMEKQRCARAAALSGKSLDCPGCNDSSQECTMHHVPGTTVPTPPQGQQQGGGRRVQATKSEAHTTTSGRASHHGRANAANKRMLNLQHRMHENNNQVSSTTGPGGGGGNGGSDHHHQRADHHHRTPDIQHPQLGAHPPLVLSLSQLQSGGGLLIVNSPNGVDHGPPVPSAHHSPLNGLTPLTLPPPSQSEVNGHLLHSAGSNRSAGDTMESASASSSSPLDGLGATASPVSSAVRSLNSLSDFSLDVSNGNFDTYSGLQPITDSLLSAGDDRKEDHNKAAAAAAASSAADHPHQAHHQPRPPAGNGGPLMDFKSAFSDLDSKPSDLSFLHDTLDLSHDDIQRTLQANLSSTGSGHGRPPQTNGHGPSAGAAAAAAAAGHTPSHSSGGPTPHAVDLNPMDFIEHNTGQAGHAASQGNGGGTGTGGSNMPSFDLDAFDMLGEFSELDHYGGNSPVTTQALLHHTGGQAPLLSSTACNPPTSGMAGTKQHPHHLHHHQQQQQQQHQHHHPHHRHQQITEYSPDWAWSDGGTKLLVTGPWQEEDGGNYLVLFDGIPCDATLVQNGVLRCVCPAHEAGMVKLEVSCDGIVISNTVIFEYKKVSTRALVQMETNNTGDGQQCSSTAKEEENITTPPSCNSYLCDSDACKQVLKSWLLQKLDYIHGKMEGPETEEQANNIVRRCKAKREKNHFEDYLLTCCKGLANRQWKKQCEDNFNNMEQYGCPTLLYMASALGLYELIQVLFNWQETNPHLILEKELDCTAHDPQGFTPLMRACYSGQRDIAMILYNRNPHVLRIKNFNGETCSFWAKRSVNPDIASVLEYLEEARLVEQSHRKEVGCNNKRGSFGYVKQQKPEFARPFDIGKKSRTKSLDEHRSSSSPSSHSHSRCRMKLRSTSPFRGSVSPLPAGLQQPLTITIDPHGAITSNSSPSSSSNNQTTGRRKLYKRSSFDSSLSSHWHHGTDIKGILMNRPTSKDSKTMSKNERSTLLSVLRLKSTSSSSQERPDSPYIDVEALSDEENSQATHEVAQPLASTSSSNDGNAEDQKVLTLAQQFIAAMPARIKNESDCGEPMVLDDCCSPLPCDASQSDDLGIESMGDDLDFEFDFNLDETCSYRDVCTPSSPLSPVSSCLHSPKSFTFESPSPCTSRSFSVDAGSPPCTTADLQEFLQASIKCERDLSNLTLSDQEQRELYEAAQIIQKAYRSYKGRKKMCDSQDREAKAAIVIQNYYRRYKQYLYWKQMSKAATLIQNKYRRYCEHKRFKKSQEAATCIQNYYRTYKEHQGQGKSRSSRESTPSAGLKRTYSQRRQNQAAKKIQQFMRKTHLRLQTERDASAAVNARLVQPLRSERACLQQNCLLASREATPTHITLITPTTEGHSSTFQTVTTPAVSMEAGTPLLMCTPTTRATPPHTNSSRNNQ